MALLIDELAAYAVTQSVGTLGVDLFRFALTADPDEQMALVPYRGAIESEQAFGSDSLKWEYPRVQFVSRGPVGDERTAATNCDVAYKAFGKITAETLSGTFYHNVCILCAPFRLGMDDSGRPLYAFNMQAEKEVSA